MHKSILFIVIVITTFKLIKINVIPHYTFDSYKLQFELEMNKKKSVTILTIQQKVILRSFYNDERIGF